MAQNSSKKLLLILACAAVLSCAWPGNIFADDDRVQALETRVAELEALVHQLLQNQAAPKETMEAVTTDSPAADAPASNNPTQPEEQQAVAAEKDGKHHYAWGGFVKADFMYSDFGGGPIASGSPGRDFYYPVSIPIGEDGTSYLDFSAKETRINFKTEHLLENGADLGAFIEMDFQLSKHGDERVSNSYKPRLRHAYMTYNRWLFGQTWTTLFNVDALPDNLDFIGPAESTIFGRQVMIRYTRGPWQFALENPEVTVTPYGGGDRITADDNRLPDGVLRYKLARDWGSFTAAGILRQLAYRNESSGIDDATTGYGISLSGIIRAGARDDFRWMASAGKGLGRYIGLNTTNGAVLDADGDLHAIDVFGIFGSYRHFWNEQWRSNLTLGYLSVDNDVILTGMEATRSASSVHVNLIYSPQARLDFGIEFLYADRELENGNDGDLTRVQFSSKYSF